jgi:uncharacterized protein (DUF2267 family)
MQTPFDKYALHGNQFLSQLAAELNTSDDPERTLRILKAVLHGIRNRIIPEESGQFISQLPMMIKAVYVEGWQIGKHQKRVNDFDEFVTEVYQLGGGYKGLTFGSRLDVVHSIQAVLAVLKKHVSEGEFSDALASMPFKLQSAFWDMLMNEGGLVM